MNVYRTLLWWLALVVAGALGWQLLAADSGLVLLRYRGWELSSTVPGAALMALLALVALWLLVLLLRLPLRGWRRLRRRRAEHRLHDGWMALHEGRWQRAARLLEKAAREPSLRGPALLAAVQAAQSGGEIADAQRLRAAAQAAGESAGLARIDAAQALADGRPGPALEHLVAAAEPRPSPATLMLKARALAAAGRAAEAQSLLPALRSAHALPVPELVRLETELATASLQQAAGGEALAEQWNRLGRPLRREPAVVAAFARRAAAIGLEDDAAAAIEHSLSVAWSEPLALLYGCLPPGRKGSRLPQAERWLAAHPASPALAVALGRLCLAQKLLGKAEDYLYRAIAQGAGAEAWEALAEVYVARGEEGRARLCYTNALRRGRGEAARPLPGRGVREQILDEAVAEERDEHGMPRLRTEP